MAYKRVSSRRAVKTAMRVGNWASLARASRAARGRKRPARGRLSLAYMNQRLNSLSRTIETKSGVWCSSSNVDLPHNKLHIVQSPGNGQIFLNCLQTNQGIHDDQGNGTVSNRIGDKITVKGVMFTGMFENAFNRPKVNFHFMLLKCARGDLPDVEKLYQNNTNNRLIDMINTERYTIVAQKRFTINVSSSPAASSAGVSGAPEETDYSGIQNAGMGTRLFKLWIPGRKFGNRGVVHYDERGVACKFFDYVPVIMTYDWFGSPSSDLITNNIGKINSLYSKLYFQDA